VTLLFLDLFSKCANVQFCTTGMHSQGVPGCQSPNTPPPFLLLHLAINTVVIVQLIGNIYTIHAVAIIIDYFWVQKLHQYTMPFGRVINLLAFSIYLWDFTEVLKKWTGLVS
jgi:hypothetical protein